MGRKMLNKKDGNAQMSKVQRMFTEKYLCYLYDKHLLVSVSAGKQ